MHHSASHSPPFHVFFSLPVFRSLPRPWFPITLSTIPKRSLETYFLLYSLSLLYDAWFCFLELRMTRWRERWEVWYCLEVVSFVEVGEMVVRELIEDTVLFVAGSIAFNVDRNYCAQLRAMREVVGIPLGFVLEMHAWWHIGSGLGVYYFVVLIEYLRLYLGTSGAEVTLQWESALFLPRMKVQDTKTE